VSIFVSWGEWGLIGLIAENNAVILSHRAHDEKSAQWSPKITPLLISLMSLVNASIANQYKYISVIVPSWHACAIIYFRCELRLVLRLRFSFFSLKCIWASVSGVELKLYKDSAITMSVDYGSRNAETNENKDDDDDNDDDDDSFMTLIYCRTPQCTKPPTALEWYSGLKPA